MVYGENIIWYMGRILYGIWGEYCMVYEENIVWYMRRILGPPRYCIRIIIVKPGKCSRYVHKTRDENEKCKRKFFSENLRCWKSPGRPWRII